ncbi:hypothetical protein B0T22DRAFT_207077 [Podospora appendiculata]|uniref:DSC E3 ubiquitin ligase complex subunit A n=1 Tax=Podospora appendiculata TaxID=314037 RepID=A0AAE0X4F6_9PEZI|nr:hypothetical protein B0T22DRAFT_207077 [Podospora appendiculata]
MPQSQDSFRVILIVLLLFWVLISPDNGPSITAPSIAAARLARQRHAHSVLNTTRWGDFAPLMPADPAGTAAHYLNLTGFKENDGYAWADLQHFRDRCRESSRNAYPPNTGRDDWDHGLADLTWQNATGTVHGEWVRRQGTVVRHPADYNLTDIAPGTNWPAGYSEWGRNMTGDYGKIRLRLEEDSSGVVFEDADGDKDRASRSASLVRETSALVIFQDEASGAGSWNMRLYGVHWPRQGAILLSTTSEKFAGIFGLPHFAPGPDFFHSSQMLLNQTVGEVLRKKARSRFTDPSNPWSSTVEGSEDPWALSLNCEYVMYLQLHPIDSSRAASREGLSRLVDEMERELRYPTGAPIKSIPDLRMSLVAWSPDCSYYLESKGPPRYSSADGQHLVGMKEEVFIYRVKTWLLAFAAVLMGQTWLLKAQMKESSTPSTIGRVSFYTGSSMLLADGLVVAGASVWSLSATNMFLPCLMVTFAAFMSMVLGGAFLNDVYKIQEPERRIRERERVRERERDRSNANSSSTRASPPAAAPAAPPTNTLPRPVTAPPPPRPSSPPIIIPSDQDIDAEIAENLAAGAGAIPTAGTTPSATTTTTANRPPRATTFASITGRFVILGTFLIFLSAAASSWPTEIRALYINSLAFLYLSLWVPQIWRNLQRNSRRAFAWRFMIGQSVLRLLPLAYFYLPEENIVFGEPDWRAFAVLAGWVWLQLWVLAFQDVLGPRFGIPPSWTPDAWDYHPVLREDNLEAGGLPIGLVTSPSGPGGSPVLDRVRSWSLGAADDGSSGGAHARERDKDRERRGMHVRCIDCAICRETLEVPVVRAGADDPSAGGVAGVLARRAYMVTPCRHIFHTKCLEGWLRFRLQCPICREELPPL